MERRSWHGVYDAGTTPFDLGEVTPALRDWLDGHPVPPGRALVPGCGRGHDVIELARRGFDALGVDQEPWDALPALEEGSIDLWWENTCYCAIEPSRRDEYATIAARLVRRGGTLLFLAFPLDVRAASTSISEGAGPPYPIRADEIAPRFAPHFVLRTLAPPPRPSSPRRLGRELLAVLERV